MLKPIPSLAFVNAVLSLAYLGATPAQTAPLVTFVSGSGTDAGNCADPQHPCRTFQFALNQISPFGEVKALDPADYGPVTIKGSASITGVDGASINSASAFGNAVTIGAGRSRVNLTNLTLDGREIAYSGIQLNSGTTLTITHCTVRNFI